MQQSKLHWTAVFKRAWSDTIQHFRSTWASAGFAILNISIGTALFSQLRGRAAVIDEITVFICFQVATAIVILLSVFFWKLWMAPNKIILEQMDALSQEIEGWRKRYHGIVDALECSHQVPTIAARLDRVEDAGANATRLGAFDHLLREIDRTEQMAITASQGCAAETDNMWKDEHIRPAVRTLHDFDSTFRRVVKRGLPTSLPEIDYNDPETIRDYFDRYREALNTQIEETRRALSECAAQLR